MRALLFLVGCIGVRLALAYVAYLLARPPNPRWPLKAMGASALIPAAGLLVLFFGGYRKTGWETEGRPIWWNALRPVHALLFIAFAICTFLSSAYRLAWAPLLVDALLGLGAWLVHHKKELL
jgi:hypothetical protein